MDLCDTSYIDWQVVDAVGTWIVGIGTTFLAFRASAVVTRLKAENERGEADAAKVLLKRLYLEAVYASGRIEALVASLRDAASISTSTSPNGCGGV